LGGLKNELVTFKTLTELKKRYWGKHFWSIGYGAWTTGNVTDEMVQEYLGHHRHPSNTDTGSIVLE